MGWYPIDIHNSGPDDVGVSCRTRPFQIPLGALIPVRVRNLLAGAKNLGTTHVTNGCYRLHPVEWNIGEAAGALAAYALDADEGSGGDPRRLRARAATSSAVSSPTECRSTGSPTWAWRTRALPRSRWLP